MLSLTTGEDQPLLKDPHGKKRLDTAFSLHLTEAEINRLHNRNMRSRGGSCTWRSVATACEQLCDEAPTRSTWPNSPTARVQTIWKSLRVVDERGSGSLSDLITRKPEVSLKSEVQIRFNYSIKQSWCSSLALAHLALLHLLSAAEYKPTDNFFEGSETQMHRILVEHIKLSLYTKQFSANLACQKDLFLNPLDWPHVSIW